MVCTCYLMESGFVLVYTSTIVIKCLYIDAVLQNKVNDESILM
jgi:hypothetical protein